MKVHFFNQTHTRTLCQKLLMNVLFFFGLISWLNAQTFEIVPCGSLAIEICPIYDPSWGNATGIPNPLPGDCDPCSLTSINCRSFQYSVELVTTCLPNAQDFVLDYEAILATLSLSVTGSNPIPLSRINATATQACLSGSFKNYIQVSPNGNAVTFDFHAVPNEQLPQLIFSAIPPSCNFRCHLFNVVIDAWPGETVNLSCSFPPISTSYVDGDGLPACTNDPNSSSGNGFGCSSPLGSGGVVIIPKPPASSHMVCVEFAQDIPDQIVYGPANDFLPTIPMFLNSNVSQTSIIQSLDYLIKIQSVNPIEKPKIIPFVDLSDPSNPINFTPNIVEMRVESIPNTNDWWVRIRLENVIVDPGDFSKFLDIEIQKPLNSSLPGELEISLSPGRLTGTMNGMGTCEMSCVDSDIIDICYPGYYPCTNYDYDFKFRIETLGPLLDCSPRLYLSLQWTKPANIMVAELQHIKLDLDFILSGDLVTGTIVNSDALLLPSCADCNNPTVPTPGCSLNGDNWNGCGVAAPVFDFANKNLHICFDRHPTSGEFARWNNQLYVELPFEGFNGTIDGIVVRQAEVGVFDLANNVICAAPVEIVGLPIATSPNTHIYGKIERAIPIDPTMDNGVSMVNITLDPAQVPTPPSPVLTGILGTYNLCAEPHADPNKDPNEYNVIPKKDINPLNGVSTFDLVKMSKHILNVAPFTSPFEYVAADINKNDQVTTFDIVELRKLILGIYTDFPANDSWRFVEKNYVFPSPNPLPNLKEDKFVYLNSNDREANFFAVKIGDVTGDALNNNFSGANANFEMQVPSESPEKGIITFPVKSGGNEPLIAVQAGFQFDPNKLELVGVSKATIKGLNADCFGYNELGKGIIKLIWLSPDMEDEALMPGQVLCYLTFKQKGKQESMPTTIAFSTDPNFKPLGFTIADKVFALKMDQSSLTAVPVERGNGEDLHLKPRIEVRPNPTDGATMLYVEVPEEEKMSRLSIYGPFGVRMFYKEFKFAKGVIEIPIPESMDWPTGVYTWQWMGSKSGKIEGRIIRI